MGQVYLLTGPPGVGKTSTIKKVIEAIGKDRCAGFYTEEIHTEKAFLQGRRGFQLVTLDGRACTFAHVESPSPLRLGRYGIHLDCLETIGLTALHKAVLNRKIVIVDEIGLMQIISEQFQKTMRELLDVPQSLLGTIGLQSHEWLDAIKRQKNVKIFELTQYNQKSIAETLIYTLRY